MPMAAVAAARDSAATTTAAAVRRGRAHVVAQLLSLAPFLILLAVAADPHARLLAPLEPKPMLLGIPADALLGALTLAWMAVGALLIRAARSPLVESLALLVFTVPATILAVLAPAVLVALVPRG
jgi:hypothetical protein